MRKSKIKLSRSIASEIKVISLKEQIENDRLVDILFSLPNIPMQDIPMGEGESSNLEIRRYGEKDNLVL